MGLKCLSFLIMDLSFKHNPCSQERAKEAMLYSYKHGMDGFSAKLTAEQVKALSGNLPLQCALSSLYISAFTSACLQTMRYRPYILDLHLLVNHL